MSFPPQGAQTSTPSFTFKIKSADEGITSDSTLSDDADLQFSASANKTYLVDGLLRVNSPVTPDFQYAFSIPAGAGGEWINGNWSTSTAESETLTTGETVATSGSDEIVTFRALITIGGTAGTVALKWAQNLSNAGTTTLKANSVLFYRQLD